MAAVPAQQILPPAAANFVTGAQHLQHLTQTGASLTVPSSRPSAEPCRISWNEKDTKAVTEALRLALEHERTLGVACSALDRYRDDLPPEGKDALLTIKASSAGLPHFLSSMAAPTCFNGLHSKAIKDGEGGVHVFNVPELLEHILMFSDTQVILSMLQVCKPIHNTIEGSLKLQRQLGLSAASDSFLASPLSINPRRVTLQEYPGFSCSYVDPRESWPARDSRRRYARSNAGVVNAGATSVTDDPRQLFLIATFTANRRGHFPIVGKRYLSMLLCHPPITEMLVSPICCQHLLEKLTASTGLTIGGLWNSAQAMMQKHRLCPNATNRMLDEDGYVLGHVAFEGDVKLREEDPILVAYKEQRQTRKAHADADRARQRHLLAYTAAKQAAHAAGESVPTLAQYEANVAEVSGTGGDAVDGN
ncbi:hypothetical protein LTR85_008583 [Meristemomyces frigidus]|nr:hypothetical protein LTR85_008583 [Meristemomyces frigidus]